MKLTGFSFGKLCVDGTEYTKDLVIDRGGLRSPLIEEPWVFPHPMVQTAGTLFLGRQQLLALEPSEAPSLQRSRGTSHQDASKKMIDRT